MRPVLVSQRVDAHPDRQERRDALDQRLCRFLSVCGYLPVPVPNVPECVCEIWNALRPQGVVLSGGNDLLALGGDTPEREATETLLVDLAKDHTTPVFGICRGLQFLAQRGGAVLARVPGHIACRHGLTAPHGREVNSFHQWGILALGEGWEALARAQDRSVEYACCFPLRHWGIMWHPERESSFAPEDVALVRAALGS